MKIFIVSEAGKIADVTLHTSCKSADESALKVTLMRTLMILDKHTAKVEGGMNTQPANSIVSCLPHNNSSGLFFLHLRLH